jgi:hypothetical protein
VVLSEIVEPVAVKAELIVMVEASMDIGPPDVTEPPMVIPEVFPGEPILKEELFAALITPVEYTAVNEDVEFEPINALSTSRVRAPP